MVYKDKDQGFERESDKIYFIVLYCVLTIVEVVTQMYRQSRQYSRKRIISIFT